MTPETDTSAKKVTLRDAKEDVDNAKSVSRYKKLPTTQVETLQPVSHFNTKHLEL